MNKKQHISFTEYDSDCAKTNKYYTETKTCGNITETIMYKNGVKFLYEKIKTTVIPYENYVNFECKEIIEQIRY